MPRRAKIVLPLLVLGSVMKHKDAFLARIGCEPCPTPGEETFAELSSAEMLAKPRELEDLFEKPKESQKV